MITPRLLRRSVRNALQPRLLGIFWAALIIPSAISAMPVLTFLSGALDHWPGAKGIVGHLDGATSVELLMKLTDATPAALNAGILGALLALLLLSPFVAGVTVAAARSDEALPTRKLLAGGGEFYGRMLRVFVVAALPLGVGGGIAAAAFRTASKANEKAIWEAHADQNSRNAMLVAAAALFVMHLFVDLARSHFAAEPQRRSAFLAAWGGVRLFFRRPLRTLLVGLTGSALAMGGAALFMGLRLQVTQSGAGRMALAWALAQAAQLAIGWGRGTRIFGFAELIRVDAADRTRAREFRMEPPVTSPPPAPAAPPPDVQAAGPEGQPAVSEPLPVAPEARAAVSEVQSSTLAALTGPVLSPPGRSDT